MEGPRECLVSGALAIVLQASRLVGVAPLRFNKQEGGWRVKLSPGLYKLGCFNITIIGVILTGIVVSNSKYEQYVKLTQHITLLVQLSWVMCLAGTMVYDAPRRIRTIIECVNKVQEIKFQMKNSCSFQENKRCILFLYCVFIINRFVSILGYVISFDSPGSMSVWNNVFSLIAKYNFLVVELGLMQYIVIVMHLTTGFKSINDNLKTLDTGKTTDRKSQQNAINQVRAAYESACDMVEQVNESQGFVLMTFMAYSFTHLVVCTYYFINSIYYANELVDFYSYFMILKVLKFYWCIFHLINLIIMIEPCQWTYQEMKCTRVLVGYLMRRTRSTSNVRNVSGELRLFYGQLSLYKPLYRPLDIITIKRSLLMDILSNATTYLVILINIK